MKYLALLTTLFCVSSVQAEEEAKWWFDTAEYWQEWDARESETCEQELDKDDYGLTRLGNNPPGLEVFPTPELARQRCHEIFHAAKHETQSVQALVRIELEQIEPEMIGYHNAVFRAKLRVKFEASQAPSPQ